MNTEIMDDKNEANEYEEEEEQSRQPQQAEPNFQTKISHEAKLKELLRNLTSNELKLCSDASKEFIKLLKSSAGPEILCEYTQTSSKCIELSQAWDLRKTKPGGLSCILKLISVILNQRVMCDSRTAIVLDKFARGIVEERIGDLYKELNSKEGKRQKAALLLLASAVRCGQGLAWEVAKRFDFKMASFGKLAEWKGRRRDGGKRKHLSTRKAFVGFAMSFLEVGNPRLLREILQQKGMYSGVLRGLGNDDEETVVYVLTTLHDKVLVPESLVPPGLRSVLFGSVTLEQLVGVAGREDCGLAAKVAHNLLMTVCTDPCNGLMPDLDRQPSPLRGNPKRLLDLMKKLKATEVGYHKDLLLAIVKGKPSFGSAYLDGFPYNLDDLSSPNWFAAVSLAANVVSAVVDGVRFSFLNSSSQEPPAIDNPDVQNIIKCIGARPFTRLIINKGLLHIDPLMKHATLKLVLEALKLLDSLFGALKGIFSSDKRVKHGWESLKQDIENELRMSLPDPQVLLSLLSSLNSYYRSLDSCLKRPADAEAAVEHTANSRKKLKTNNVNEDMDIIISGVSSSPDITLHEDGEQSPDEHDTDQANDVADIVKLIGEIWGMDQGSVLNMAQKDGDTFFYSKLLDALKIYHRTMPNALEGSFDFFKVLPSNPLSLPDILQRSLLSLLVEHVGWSSTGETTTRTLAQMYKHLHPFINLLMYSPRRDIKNQAYRLARAAMLSTGAFDKKPREICTWFLFIPGYSRENIFVEDHGVEMVQKLSSVIVSFLCDAVSTIGNNLFKYFDLLKRYVYDVQGAEGLCPDFSPFVICVLEKCIRLLSSEFGTFTLPEKTMISVYVCSTLKYLLETQAEAGLLSSLIDLLLSERLKCFPSIADMSGDFCEWRPMKILLLFSRNILHQQTLALSSNSQEVVPFGGSLTDTLAEVKRVLWSEYDDNLVGITIALSYSIICTKPHELLQSFPSAITISTNLYGVPLSVLSSIFYLEPDLLFSISKLWPEIFLSGGEMFMAGIRGEVRTKEIDFNSKESASAAFSFFLDTAPFHVLFSAILRLDGSLLFHNSKTISLLLDKISGTTPDNILSAFCHVLFWLNQAKISYKIKPLDDLEGFSEKCIILAEHMLKQVLFGKIDCDPSSYKWTPFLTQYIQEVAEIIFCHPAVVTTLECPLPGSEGYTDAIFSESLEKFLELAEQGIPKMDLHVLNLLRTTCEQLLSFCDSQRLSEVEQGTKEIAKVFKGLEKKLLLTLKDRFDGCVKSKDLVPLIPTSFALHLVLRFISPFELLELVHWLFSKIDLTDTASSLSFRSSVLLVALHIAGCAFDLLSAYLQEPYSQKTLYALFWGMEEKAIDVSLFEKIFFQVYEIATRFELDVADICLLKALRVVKTHQALQHCIPSIMVISRVVASTPVNLLSHCMHRVTKTKSLLLLSLAELSSLHLSFFGYLFATMINKSSLFKADLTQETCNYHLSDEELVMLLPTALLYLNSAIARFGGLHYKNFDYIPSLYWRTLFHSLSDWKSYVSKQMFEVELSKYVPVSLEQFLDLVSTSLLGKSVRMVHHYLALSGELVKMETRLNLFDSLCLPSSKTDDLLDCNLSQVGIYSLGQCLNIVNRVAAKIYFSRLLLFPEHVNFGSMLAVDGDVKDIPPEVNSNALDLSRMRFLNILVRSWRLIVKKFPSNIDNPKETEGQKYSLFKFLEQFLRRNILDLTAEMNDCLIKLPRLTFVEQLAKSTLLHRFEDPGTLKMLRTVLTMLSEGNFPCISLLQLLLAHSGFAQTIHSANNSGSTSFGMIFTPMPSILRSLAIPHTHLNSLDRETNMYTFEHMKQLEVIKLLRVLLRTSAQQCDFNTGKGIEINLRELVLLLLSSYGATLSEIDLEIYNLISEIEAIDKSCTESLGEMDYLWGIAASKVRKEREQEHGGSSDDLNNTEAVGELRKIQFRENFPVDPKMCAATILNFPCFRAVGEVTSDKLQKDNFEYVVEGHSAENKKMQTYDPVFILRFSIHCLSMGYVEPLEFASSGLLAITIASLSSPHDDLRKFGYQALGRFKSELERTQKRKDVTRLRLLLSYLQNGIEQPWQRVSSITAVFVAEATLVLLNSSHDYYSTISKLLMCSPSANMKSIPLFQSFFWSSSVNFNADRSWMLRLLYTGLNTDDDAHIYIRNSVFEIVLSFYMSPLSNDDSKELILQMLKKSAKLHKMARYLVEQCGLIPWLSSAISSYCGSQSKDKGRFPLTQLTVGLEVLSDIISSRNMVEWLQKSALEQIAEFSVHLHKFLVDRMELIKEQTSLVGLCLHILASALKISQKRKIYQPHFTLSTEGLLCLCEAVDVCSSGRCSLTAELGLKAILMSTPAIEILHMDPEKLLKFVSWAISTAVQAKARKVGQTEESFNVFRVFSEEENSNDSLVSKLLRWLTASVIRGRLSWRLSNPNSSSLLGRTNPPCLQTLLEWHERGPAENPTEFVNEETLAASIFYLQQLLGINCKSVVSALCLLLFTNSSSAGTEVPFGHANSFASLFSKISCPAEANPLWRWSFYQPWKDLSSQPTEGAKVEEIHACQILLVEISNMLGRKPSYSQFLSLNDVKNSHVFEWEISILKSQ